MRRLSVNQLVRFCWWGMSGKCARMFHGAPLHAHADAAQRLHWCWRAASRSAASCVSSPGRRRRRRRLRDEGRLRSRRWLRFARQRRFAATGITAHSSASAPPLLPKSSSAPRRKRAGPRCSERSICERGHAAAERAAQLHVAGTTWLLSPLPSASEHSALVEGSSLLPRTSPEMGLSTGTSRRFSFLKR